MMFYPFEASDIIILSEQVNRRHNELNTRLNNETNTKISQELTKSEAESVDLFLSGFDDSFFGGLDWLETASKNLYPSGAVDYLLGRTDSGEMIGFSSFVRTKTQFLKFFHPTILALTGTRSVVSPEHLDLHILKNKVDVWSDFLLGYLDRQLGQADFVIFDSVRDNPEGIKAIINLAEGAGYKIIKQNQDVCPYLDLPDDFEALLNCYSANMRKITRRTLKRSGDRFRLVDYSEVGDLAEAFSLAGRLHELSRNQKGDKSSFDRTGYVQFHIGLARRLAEKDQLYFKFLMADNQPVSFRYGFLDRSVYYDYQTGYDPDYSKDRPGFLIVALVIKELIDLKVTRYDFLRGDEPYKKHWALGRRKSYRYYIFGRSFKSRLYYQLFRFYNGLKK